MNLVESIAVGLVYGFIFYEWIGLSPGGLVVPGYMALYLDRPLVVMATLGLSALAWGLVHTLSRFVVLYGKRRFVLMILAGFVFQWLFRSLLIQTQFMAYEMDTIGFIIPGLVANEMEKQGFFLTVCVLLIVSVLVRLTLILLGLLRPL